MRLFNKSVLALCFVLTTCATAQQPAGCKNGYTSIPNMTVINGMPMYIGTIPVCNDPA